FVPQEQAAAVGVRIVELDELFRTSDFVSIHCPPTSEDKGLINRETLARMKRGSYLVNLSRGSLVESLDALDEALESGRLAGVGLDVFDPAHPDVTHPIFKRENCLTSPHSMATTEGALTRIFKAMADDMAAVLRGERLKHVVNPEVFE
ncbi:MAG: phosphoglycerate dehydrogenase, partial [Betaproteobacteria bacterium]